VDVNSPEKRKESKSKKKRNSGGSEDGFARFHINIGSKNNLSPTQLIGMINDATQTRDMEIGRIEILKKFSFFEVPETEKNFILESFHDFDFRGVEVIVEPAQASAYSTERNYGDRKKRKNRKFDRQGAPGSRRGSSRGGEKKRKFSGRKGR